jgi:hypothetical protein
LRHAGTFGVAIAYRLFNIVGEIRHGLVILIKALEFYRESV